MKGIRIGKQEIKNNLNIDSHDDKLLHCRQEWQKYLNGMEEYQKYCANTTQKKKEVLEDQGETGETEQAYTANETTTIPIIQIRCRLTHSRAINLLASLKKPKNQKIWQLYCHQYVIYALL